MELNGEALERVVSAALAEDVGSGDLTTEGVVPESVRGQAELLIEEPGVVCGVPAALLVFTTLDPSIRTEALAAEGARIAGPAVVARIEGAARAILTGERTALNLLGRLSGVATLTSRYVELVEGTGTTILDTRKTTPGLRALEKYAVSCGGARNHRAGLHDAILLKENHLRIAGGITAALGALGDRNGTPVEVEAESLEDVAEALAGGAGRILLDNMTVAEISRAVELVDGRVPLEASGGITLENLRAYAETGVDFISVGALTHAAHSLSVSLDLEVA
ncbi:MAG TPA: carboxylating nicotinate-nucleotide diphosphorylase [Gaiellaceae bacterium]|nr:carboxylating nicotinate-nucleotide diphosphorylase [Gaiellaceae bacterium]